MKKKDDEISPAVESVLLDLDWTPPENPTNDDLSRWIWKEYTNNFEGRTSTAVCRQAVIDGLPELRKDAKRGEKIIESARKGHEQVYGTDAEKIQRREEYRRLLKELRLECPSASNRRIYEIAEAMSPERFGGKVSYKTFERADKMPE